MKPTRSIFLILFFFTTACQPRVTLPAPVILPSPLPPTLTLTLETPSTTPSEYPTPEPIIITATPLPASETPLVTETASVSPTLALAIPPGGFGTQGPTATRTRRPKPTWTPTYTPTPPAPLLAIERPGLLSNVVSPIRIEALISRGENGLVYADLIGEDGRTISYLALDYRKSEYSRFVVAPTLEFQIPGVSETARLELHTVDGYGRFIALSSVDLVLLSIGNNQINPPQIRMEPYIIRYPEKNMSFKGGILLVNALVRRVNPNPLIIELINSDNRVVGSRELPVDAPTAGLSHTPVLIDIPYQVPEKTQARLVLRQISDTRIPGTAALNSVAIILEP